jgi:hypothetical protein
MEWQIFDLGSRQILRQLKGHKGCVIYTVFSIEGFLQSFQYLLEMVLTDVIITLELLLIPALLLLQIVDG